MAVFSYDKHNPLLLDSSSLLMFSNTSTPAANITTTTDNNSTHVSCFLEQSIHNNYNPCFSPHHHHSFYDQLPDRTVEVSSFMNISSGSTSGTTKLSTCSNNSTSSEVTAQCHQLLDPMDKRKMHFQQPVKDKKQKQETTSGSNIGKDCMNMRSEEKAMNNNNKRKKNRKSAGDDDEKKKGCEEMEKNEAPSGYIHVRARRGQATDSHSLAERVRREKISERMKLLQALVPGCDKVTGKALMLDEIINYVQSLQNQVEFLSMKIASVSPMLYDFGMDLDAYMIKPEVQNQSGSSLEAAKQQDVHQQNNGQATSNMLNTYGGYSLMQISTLLQLQQAQVSNIMSQSQSQSQQLYLSDADERQKIISQFGYTNNLSSFHKFALE